MKLILNMDGRDTCTIEIWEDRFPAVAEALRKVLPVTSIAQHGKIVGDLLYFCLPVVMPNEKPLTLTEICRQRRAEKGTAGGSVCFYGPRQQICIYYGDDVSPEPFELSYCGEIIEGNTEMELAAVKTWTSPGVPLTLRLA
ncbi:hypothetical protein [Kaistia adipata]|uniref:hypothetical protein n=1 Tax=Kaistia adipata TaxID=166954 RepID=UPI0004074146|nr:hypothetical protein [Kaistia adipata]